MKENKLRVEYCRALKFLARGRVKAGTAARPGRILLERCGTGQVFRVQTIADLVGRGLVRRTGESIEITSEGRFFLKRDTGSDDRFRTQHQNLATVNMLYGAEKHSVTVNRAESPLGAIAARKSGNGNPFLADAEFNAGERLRRDFERGALMPRTTSSWEHSPSMRRSGAPGGNADLTDNALAARSRVERALTCVGPELAGVLSYICCFHKGLEQVETERSWPRRSAKIMLKTALAALARHYWPADNSASQVPQPVRHWGTGDYRPRVGGFASDLPGNQAV